MRSSRKRGLALVELLVVIAIVSGLIAILLPVLAEARAAGRETVCLANLRQNGTAFSTYAADANDVFATYSWRSDTPTPTRESALRQSPGSANQAASWQAADILIRRGVSEAVCDFAGEEFYPWSWMWHLPIADHLDNQLPFETAICPSDRVALDAAIDPLAAGVTSSDNEAYGREIWNLLSSSYVLTVSAYDRAQSTKPDLLVARSQSEYDLLQSRVRVRVDIWSAYDAGTRKDLGGVPTTWCHFPSAKALLIERIDRHGQKPLPYMDEKATPNVLFVDGSARSVRPVEMSIGWSPSRPYEDDSEIIYKPVEILGDPVPEGSNATPTGPRKTYLRRLEWTRGGMRGLDKGSGLAVPTTNN